MNAPIVKTTDFPTLILRHRGKVRDMYGIPGYTNTLLMVATDRISAYDVVMYDAIPGKGKVLTRVSLFWFDLLGDIVENHLDQLRGRSMLIKKAKPLTVECIVRGYISGSFWSAYKKAKLQSDGRGLFKEVLGLKLPPNMEESEKFYQPLFTPSTKAEQGLHDENISIEQMEKIVGKDRAHQIAEICLALYEKAAKYALECGIIIADTKFELGETEDGTLILIDEVLTPDSSRFWPVDKYEPGKSQPSFDKQYLRDYLSSLDWDKTPPPPPLPQKVIDVTKDRYDEALKLLTSK
ncbi:MAG: Phosphoribosylaminoimidazole-succinocarboxamide synthase [Candidatus Moranbacteria bacterium GW2011_GWE2_35_164]|nr:MAG: Phosphoribosylaminoimidazole-succinocarboxamide synthase [Candidatus Moranbacteria bacterium GW2011_GWE2_35_164]